jgi:hypothetical protein
MAPLEQSTLAKEKYPDCTSAAWSMAIVNFIKKNFVSEQWDDQVNLIG